MKKNSLFLSGLLVVILLALGLQTVSAQQPQPTPSDNAVNEVAHELYCPVCENIPLDVCPTQACAQWREQIRLQLSQGMTKEQIKQYFANNYGDRVLSEPPLQGLHLLVYVLPPLFFLGGLVILIRVLRSARRPARSTGLESTAAAAAAVDNPVGDPYLARLEEQLKKKD